MADLLKADDVSALLGDQLIREAETQWSRNWRWQNVLEGLLTKVWMPDGADAEYKDLYRKARSPWLRFGAESIAQGLVVDGYSDTRVWDSCWQGSGMDGKQAALNYEAVAYGYSYLLSFPGTHGSVMRPLSVFNTYSHTEDMWSEISDYVLHRTRKGIHDGNEDTWRLFDGEAMYSFTGGPGNVRDMEIVEHGLGEVPVTRVDSRFSYGEFPDSVVKNGERPYQRVVDSVFTLQMVQRYGAFPQKYQAGGEIATDEDGNAMIRPSVDSIVHSDDPTSKFGTFAAADIDKVVSAVDANLQQLAAKLQIPPHYLLGKVVNLSSDALAATEGAYMRLLNSLQESMGEGYERALRVAAAFDGNASGAADISAELHWQDTQVRSLAQVADAVQKVVSVGGPVEPLLQMIPGVTKRDLESASFNQPKPNEVDTDGTVSAEAGQLPDPNGDEP